MRPTWVDGKVAAAWVQFISLMEERNAPEDLMELLTLVDHALLSEAVRQRIEDMEQHEVRRVAN